jgi:hypothetical protein
MLAAVREGAGDDTYLLASSGPTLNNIGYLDGARMGADFGYFNGINNGPYWDPAPPGVLSEASNYYTHRKFFLNDPSDGLTVDKPHSLQEAQVNATIHGMSAPARP